jgi:hypothetical protein
MEENNRIESLAAQAILDAGVEYRLPEKSRNPLKKIFGRFRTSGIIIRPLKFGTVLSICREISQAGLTLQGMEEGEKELPAFLARFAEVTVRCVAIAILNDKKKIASRRTVRKKADCLSCRLTNYQVYELFTMVVGLAGLQDFMNTIRFAWMIKKVNLSPRSQGS